MIDKKETLTFVAKELNEAQLKWALIGSMNLMLQGMDVIPNDIDVLAGIQDKDKIKKLFEKEKLIRSSVLENKEAEEIFYLINGNEVQFCFENDHGFYAEFLENEKFEIVELGVQKISCLKLEDEANGYEYLGRKEKAEKIREFLKN